MNQGQKLFNDHHEEDQCLRCIKNQNEIIKIDNIIKEHEKMVDNQKSKEDEESHSKIISSIEQQETIIEKRNTKYSNFNFRLIKKYPKKSYTSFVFNQDSTLLFAGGYKFIKVLKFKNETKLLQTLSFHTHYIYSLIFMNNSNLLVSGSWDNSIIIWSKGLYCWKQYQTLKGHQDWVTVIINNKDEDLLISGSEDCKIKFWRNINMNWSCQQTIEINFRALCLSLNNSQQKLISCGINKINGKEILVMELIQKEEQEQWDLTQAIEIDCIGFQLSFITDSAFVFQGEHKFFEIYQYQQDKRMYFREKKIEFKKGKWTRGYIAYPCKFFESKGILILKNGNYLNCFLQDNNHNYTLQQQLEFSDDYYFGNISNDGQFLVTSDRQCAVQVRRFQTLY